MAEISFTYLNGPDIAALEMGDQEILDAVEAGLRAQGQGQTVIEPRVHLEPDPAFRGHFNVLRGYVAPLGLAGVKIVGDYIDNYRKGLPSEMAILNLFDPRTGMPLALLDATAITEMRTGAVTALGAKYLARRDSRVQVRHSEPFDWFYVADNLPRLRGNSDGEEPYHFGPVIDGSSE
jgi:ornithine cyclodeaminase